VGDCSQFLEELSKHDGTVDGVLGPDFQGWCRGRRPIGRRGSGTGL